MLSTPRSVRKRTIATLLLAGAVLVPSVAFAQSIRVTPLARDGQVLVSFELDGAFTEEVRAAIQSGLPTSFTYDVELRRAVPLWVDRLINSARVTATVRYDNLTRRYQVVVTHDGRVADTQMTDDEAVVYPAVTQFQRLPLFSTRPLEANAEYYIRVRVETRPRNALFLMPFGRDGVLGSAPFTFLPR
jgi:hypothetical protein